MNEKELSIALGISRDMFKEIRVNYKEGKDWSRIKSNKAEKFWEIEWTKEGIEALKVNLGLNKDQPVETPSNKKGKVVRKYVNPRIIGIVLDDEPDKEHNVLCRESNKFNLNMPVDVKWDGARWCIVRHPRFNGKY
jgi:hypothetical protein